MKEHFLHLPREATKGDALHNSAPLPYAERQRFHSRQLRQKPLITSRRDGLCNLSFRRGRCVSGALGLRNKWSEGTEMSDFQVFF